MKKILFVMLLAFSVSAIAGGKPPPGDTTIGVKVGVNSENTNLNANSNTNLNKNISVSEGGSAYSSAKQGQHQSQGNSQSMTYNESEKVDYSGEYTIKTTPTIVAPDFGTANPCTVGISGGVSAIGGGITLGGHLLDEGCDRRANAARLAELGLVAAAQELMCDDEAVKAARKRAGMPCGAVAAQPAGNPAQEKDYESLGERGEVLKTDDHGIASNFGW